MMAQNKMIVYELNEISPDFLNRYIKKFPNSNFSNFFKSSCNYTTLNKDIGIMSPWITWPTVHRGVNNTFHQISDIGQNLDEVDKRYPNYFDILVKHNVKVGLFGSFQCSKLPENFSEYAFYIPDSFSDDSTTHPKNIEPFQKLNLYMTRRSGRNIKKVYPIKDMTKFIINSRNMGVSNRTFFKITTQLLWELINNKFIVRRRTTQSQIAFDIFMKLLKDNKPDFVTFFTNHVASAMHRYWPASFPEDYVEFKMPKKWVVDYKNEIWHAMHEADYQIGELVKFTKKNPEYKITIMSSMGQDAVQDSQMLTNQLLLTYPEKLFDFLNFKKDEWSQHLAMSPEYVFSFKLEKSVNKFINLLKIIKIRGLGIDFKKIDNNSIRVVFGHKNFNHHELIEYGDNYIKPNDIGLEITKIQDLSGSYAYHIKEGVLLVGDKNSKKTTNDKIVDSIMIAPSLLRYFNIPTPEYMCQGPDIF